MADRNRNGIDDKFESSYGRTRPGEKSDLKITGQKPTGIAGFFQDIAQGPLRAGANFMGTLGSFLSSKPDYPKGQNIGDQIFGVPQVTQMPGNRAREGGGTFGPLLPAGNNGAAPVAPKNLLDYLSQAGSVVDQLGIGQAPQVQAVDYSGAMGDARSTASTNRAYLGAIYNQLRQGLKDDRAGIEDNFGEAIDHSQDIASAAQSAISSGYGAAAAKQAEAAKLLGMENAAASQQLDRPTTEQRAAAAIADSAAKAQNAQTMYNSQQANALEHNTNVAGASRFAETRAQGDLETSLRDRLTQLAQLQAESNAQAASANAANAGQRSSAVLSLAESLYGNAQAQSQQDFENQLSAIKLQQQQNQPQAPSYTLEQLMRGQQDSGLSQPDFLSYMKLLNSLNS